MPYNQYTGRRHNKGQLSKVFTRTIGWGLIPPHFRVFDHFHHLCVPSKTISSESLLRASYLVLSGLRKGSSDEGPVFMALSWTRVWGKIHDHMMWLMVELKGPGSCHNGKIYRWPKISIDAGNFSKYFCNFVIHTCKNIIVTQPIIPIKLLFSRPSFFKYRCNNSYEEKKWKLNCHFYGSFTPKQDFL